MEPIDILVFVLTWIPAVNLALLIALYNRSPARAVAPVKMKATKTGGTIAPKRRLKPTAVTDDIAYRQEIAENQKP